MSNHDKVSQTTGVTCPVCGRHQAVWLDDPPNGCLLTGAREVCAPERTLAYAAAIRRRICPSAYDTNGKLLPGALPKVIEAMQAVGLDPFSGDPSS